MAKIPNWCYGFAKSSIDLALLGVAFSLAFWTRFEGAIPDNMVTTFWCALPLVLLFKYTALIFHSVPRLAWRSVSVTEIRYIVRALGVGSLTILALRLLSARV